MQTITAVFCLASAAFAARKSASQRDVGRFIFADYDKTFLPVADSSVAVDVTVNANVYGLIDVSESHESITFLLWMDVYWSDYYLMWNASDFDGIDRIVLPASEIWTPDIFIYNTIAVEENVLPPERTFVQIWSSGRVTMTTSNVITVKCKFHVIQFPFDVQRCKLRLSTWGHTTDFITIKSWYNETRTIKESQNHPEWNLLEITAHHETMKWDIDDRWEVYDEIHFFVKMKRRPLYYVNVIVMPTFIVTVICVAGLFTQSSSCGNRGEKVSLGMTALLALAVLLQIVSEQVPKIADGIPLLEIYILVNLFCCALATLFTVVIISIHQRALAHSWKLPQAFGKILQSRIAEARGDSANELEIMSAQKGATEQQEFSLRSVKQSSGGANAVMLNEQLLSELKSVRHLNQQLLSELKSVKHLKALRNSSKSRENQTSDQWMDFFNIIDTILLVIFIIITAVVLLVFMSFYS